MGERFDFFPTAISQAPYLNTKGRTQRDATVTNLDAAIIALENAIIELKKLQGLGTELYIARLQKEIEIYEKLRRAIRSLV